MNTGEVVAGDPSTGQRLVTGDAVNVAARLEQAAGEREVLLGELTYRLVRDSVEVEEVEPLTLKGKSEPVPPTSSSASRRAAMSVRRGARSSAVTGARAARGDLRRGGHDPVRAARDAGRAMRASASPG